MIRHRKIKQKTTVAVDSKLDAIDVYSVQSTIDRGTRYAVDYDEFGIIKHGEMITCSLDEVPTLADMLIPEIKEEVLAIYEDVTDLARMGVNYANKYKPHRGEKEPA